MSAKAASAVTLHISIKDHRFRPAELKVPANTPVTLVVRKSAHAQPITCPAIDTLAAELDAFADAIEKIRPYPVSEAEVLATLAAFEAALASIESGQPVACNVR